jgi:hypothetical protein
LRLSRSRSSCSISTGCPWLASLQARGT